MRPIPGHRGYAVDRDGAVWSRRQSVLGRWKRLRPATNHNGYQFVNLCADGGGNKTRFVHRLVLLAYVGEPLPDQTHTRHLDGNPANNRLPNLTWGTPTENALDSRKHGSRSTKIDEEIVREVRRLHDAGLSLRAIAISLPIGKSEVHRIVTGKHWGWVS